VEANRANAVAEFFRREEEKDDFQNRFHLVAPLLMTLYRIGWPHMQ
jgi:hypothetical protein